MKIEAYLFFPGNAREAMEFYHHIFGGELAVTTKGDVDPSASPEEKNLIVNASLSNDEFNLRASDRSDSTLNTQKRVALSLIGTDEQKLRRLYDDLSAGGTAGFPLRRESWGDTFGTLTDKYGIDWQVDIEANKEAQA